MKERTSLWLYRALAVVIAVAMWYVTVAEKRAEQSEKTIKAGVTYNGRPEGIVILNGQVPNIRPVDVAVRLRGTSQDIRRLRDQEVDIQVDLTGANDPGPFPVLLEARDVLTPHDGLEVVSIEPNTLNLQLDRVEQKELAIDYETFGEPAAGARVKTIEISPATALLEGPRSVLQQISGPLRVPIDLDGHAIDYSEKVAVLAPKEAQEMPVSVVRPAFVEVKVDFEEPRVSEGAAAGL